MMDGNMETDRAESVLDLPAGVLRYLERLPSNQKKRLVMAIDFGTTYSAISYVAVNEGEDPRRIPKTRISSIRNYPGASTTNARDRMKDEVPTEAIYPNYRQFRKKQMWDGVQQNGKQTDGMHPDADPDDRFDDGKTNSEAMKKMRNSHHLCSNSGAQLLHMNVMSLTRG